MNFIRFDFFNMFGRRNACPDDQNEKILLLGAGSGGKNLIPDQ
jgi:hypothetical protein